MKTMVSIQDIPNGSALKILGTNERTGHLEDWYGQKCGVKNNKLEIALLEKFPDGTLRIGKDGYKPEFFEVETIQQFEPIVPIECFKAHKQAWLKMGIRLIESNPSWDTFVILSKEDADKLISIGDGDESDSDEEEDTFDSLDGFIVRDDEEIEFTKADPNESDWVATFHQEVQEYENAECKTETQRKVKNFIDRLEQKATHANDEKRFKRGVAGLNTTLPLKKKRRV